MNTLVIYSAAALQTNTVRDYVEAFDKYLPSNVFYEAVEAFETTKYSLCLDFIDVVIVHYSANFHYGFLGVTQLSERLRGFGGLKVLFTQDDYDFTDNIKAGIDKLKPTYVYTVLPSDTLNSVYNQEISSGTKFVNCLTGYVPERFLNIRRIPISEREIDVGYRGRALPPWYGLLGFEKTRIGRDFKYHARNTQLNTDIEWETGKRIFGKDWDDFLGNCRTTLASESGCNVFDFDGSIRNKVQEAMKSSPSISDWEIYRRHVEKYEDLYPKTNQVSPKMFESIAMGTPLIMFPGKYSDIFVEDRHYISIQKDFSNFKEVEKKIRDTEYLEHMVNTAYEEILTNHDYSYRNFCEQLWATITEGRSFKNHTLEELHLALDRVSMFALTKGHMGDTYMVLSWGFRKSRQYIKEWGFKVWMRKISFLVMRKLRSMVIIIMKGTTRRKQ